jgi:diguanylate cyclase (GGDEF)-like protein
LDSKSDNGPAERLLKIRQALLERIWRGLIIVALVGAPASVSRAFSTGWLHLYSFYLVGALLIVAVYWYRARISFATKSALVLLVFWGIGLAAVVSLGILGAGYWWLVMSSLLVSTLYSFRAGIATAVVVTVLMAAIGAGFISGTLNVPLDANVYIVSVSSWVNLLLSISLVSFIVFRAIAAFQESTLVLLDEVHKQRDRIELLATHDQLTGLPTLALADDRLLIALHAARRTGGKVALMFIDLDGFKAVNDSFGHAAGDLILQEVAKRVSGALRAGDTAARVGGDEFIAILGALQNGQLAAQVARRVIASISRPIDCAGHSISVGASIGIGLFPDHADDAQSLRRVADKAMYKVKRTGRNCFEFAEHEYEPDESIQESKG